MIIDFRRDKSSNSPVTINDKDIEVVDEYKYLGTILDSKLSWNSNTNSVYKKCKQRLHLLWKLKHFKIDQTILMLFYRSFIQTVMTFNFICWYGNLSVQNKNKILKIKTQSSWLKLFSFKILFIFFLFLDKQLSTSSLRS